MPKALCVQNFSSGGGEAYEAGVEYDVPAATLKANHAYFKYFKQASRPTNKMAETTENKA